MKGYAPSLALKKRYKTTRKWPNEFLSLYTLNSRNKKIIAGFSVAQGLQTLIFTVFTRLNAAAFIKFLAFPMRRLFEGGVYFKIIFLKLLTTITVNHL